MLKKHSELFRNLLYLTDLILIVIVWIFAYYLRFYTNLIPLYKDFTPPRPYFALIVPILLIWGIIFRAFNLYRPRRISSRSGEVLDIAKACSMAVVILIALAYFFKMHDLSRVVFLYFLIFSIVTLSFSRVVFRETLRYMRRKGYNLRHTIIVGDGMLSRELINRLEAHPELGLEIVGLLTGRPNRVGKSILGKKIIGGYEEIELVLEERHIDQVFVALPFSDIKWLEDLLFPMTKTTASVKFVPDMRSFLSICGGVEEFDGLPILSVQGSPMYGWNIVKKRLFDVVTALLSLVVFSPLMILVAIITKLSSHGPVLYRQERMGLDGRTFQMLKFRTMKPGSENETGPVWAKEGDSRRTWFGAFLRHTSLDELPQFYNVLRGDMSVVGPRPERPVFIGQFKDSIPKYMLRHKMKAGITGWAQINGWRGNTDLNKRIEYDLFYIENWSICFDIKIVWKTIWRGMVDKHAY